MIFLPSFYKGHRTLYGTINIDHNVLRHLHLCALSARPLCLLLLLLPASAGAQRQPDDAQFHDGKTGRLHFLLCRIIIVPTSSDSAVQTTCRHRPKVWRQICPRAASQLRPLFAQVGLIIIVVECGAAVACRKPAQRRQPSGGQSIAGR
jgi:hypothetical protein